LAAKNRRVCLAESKLPLAEELRFSVLTDMHYADKPPGGTRHYRATPRKLAEASRHITEFKPQFVVELGDVIDAAESVEQEKQYLQTIHKQLEALPGENHYVLGNHCVYWLTKSEFLEVVNQPRAYYSFDVNGHHFIVLDACFRSDGEPYGRKNFRWTDANLPQEELDWLEADLKQTAAPTIVFIHQRLDVDDHYGVKNAAAVRSLLEKSGHVDLVLQGHNHKNDYKEIGDIAYVTVTALVEGAGPDDNAYANVRIDKRGNVHIAGFARQKSYQWTN
jgi:alkaline phosphatase